MELCARLNQPLDEELTVYYTTESANETAEKQGIIILVEYRHILCCWQTVGCELSTHCIIEN